MLSPLLWGRLLSWSEETGQPVLSTIPGEWGSYCGLCNTWSRVTVAQQDPKAPQIHGSVRNESAFAAVISQVLFINGPPPVEVKRVLLWFGKKFNNVSNIHGSSWNSCQAKQFGGVQHRSRLQTPTVASVFVFCFTLYFKWLLWYLGQAAFTLNRTHRAYEAEIERQKPC